MALPMLMIIIPAGFTYSFKFQTFGPLATFGELFAKKLPSSCYSFHHVPSGA
jgi:hypothetical protein